MSGSRTGLGLALTLLVGGEGQVLENVGLGEALGVVGRLLQHAGHRLVHPEHRVVVVVVHVRLSTQLEAVIRGHFRAAG